MYIYIIIFLLKLSEGLIYLDMVYIDVLPLGKMTVHVDLKKMDLFYEAFGSTKCPFEVWASYPCNVEIYGKFCSYYKLLNDEEYKKYFPYDDVSFKVNRFRHVIDTYRHFLKCSGDPALFKLPVHTNYKEYVPPKYWFSNAVEYSNYIHISFQVGDHDWFMNLASYEFYLLISKGYTYKTTLFKKVTHTIYKHSPQINANVLFNIQYYLQCQRNYYGKSCWYKCLNTSRQTCTCKTNLSYYINVPCNITCKKGFLPESVSYLSQGNRQIIRRCIAKDMCESTHCKNNSVCLSMNDNKTRYCVKFNRILKDSENGIITNDIFFEGEVVTVVVQPVTFSNIGNTFIRIDDYYYTFDATTILSLRISGQSFVVTGDYYDKEFLFFTIVYIEAWNKVIRKDHKFRIYSIPKEVNILRTKRGIPITYFIYINEYIMCNSSSRPSYRTLYFWTSSKQIKLSIKFGQTTIGPPNIFKGSVDITCNVTLISKRPSRGLNLSKTINVIIKEFGDFGWSQKNNILHEENNLYCSVSMYKREHLIYVQQIKGLITLNITNRNSTVELTNVIGGYYAFYCYLRTKSANYSRIQKFYLRKKPKNICFYIHAKVRGSIVQCGHDGYFEDDYIITVKFYTFNGFYILSAENTRYLRIPYDAKGFHYKIICEVVHINNRHDRITKGYSSDFDDGLISPFNVTGETASCITAYPYVTKPSIKDNNTNETYWVHSYNFNIEINPLSTSVVSVLLIIILITANLSLAAFVFLLFEDDHNTVVSNADIAKLRKRLIRHYIHYRLCVAALKLIDLPNEKIFKFYDFGVFDKSKSVLY